MPNIAQLGSFADYTNSAYTFRNRAINGDMRIDQRNAGALVTGGAAAYTFPVDRFKIYTTLGSKLSAQQITSTVPTNFNYAVELKSLAATTPGSTDEYGFYHMIEGNNVADLNWGSSSAKPITISFWARSSLTGTFSLSIYNNAANRTYVTTYVISSANTWEWKNITIPGDTTGTWPKDASRNMAIIWDCGIGSFWETSSTNTWSGTLYQRASGAVRLINTNGATLQITGVQVEAGVVATPFEFRPIGTELNLCQRYYQKFNFIAGGLPGLVDSTTLSLHSWPFIVPLRAAVGSSAITTSSAASFEVRRGGVAATTVSALSFDANGTENSIRFSATSGSLTVGQSVILCSSTSSSVFLAVSAEY